MRGFDEAEGLYFTNVPQLRSKLGGDVQHHQVTVNAGYKRSASLSTSTMREAVTRLEHLFITLSSRCTISDLFKTNI